MTEQSYIQLGTVKRATEDMKGGSGKEINGVRYYTFDQAIETAKQQGLTLPTKENFIESGFTEKWTKENKKLVDKLGFELSGYCGSDGRLNDKGLYGYYWSASLKDYNYAGYLEFDEYKGELNRFYRNSALPVRPVLKNSTSDNSSIGLFEHIVERAESYGAKLGVKAGYDLGKILYYSIQEND